MTGGAGPFQILLFKLFLMDADVTVRTEVGIDSAIEFKLMRWLLDLQIGYILFRWHVTLPTVLHCLMFAEQTE